MLLLKNGYNWIQYVSFEHEIENRKAEYYQVLRSCQAKRPNEDITVWVSFFLNCLKNRGSAKIKIQIAQFCCPLFNNGFLCLHFVVKTSLGSWERTHRVKWLSLRFQLFH